MKVSNLLSLLPLATGLVAAGCTREQRLATLDSIGVAFNEPDLLKATEDIQNFPLQADCPALVGINGLPALEVGFDAATSKNFAILARQVFNKVTFTNTDYGNGTALFDAVILLGVVKLINTPIYAHALAPLDFNMTTCEVTALRAFVTVPSNIAGNPINPPFIPTLLGITELPGVRELLKILAPAIGNPYGL